jgi:cell division protein FtsA
MSARRMHAPRGNTLAALDIGSGKICCLIAKIDRDDDDAHTRVIGIGHQISHGLRGGSVVDIEAARNAILSAVQTAEQMAGEQIRSVTVNLSGGQLSSRTVGVEVSIANHGVRDTDLARVMDYVLSVEEKSGVEIAGRNGYTNGRLGVFRGPQVELSEDIGSGRILNGVSNGHSNGHMNGQKNGRQPGQDFDQTMAGASAGDAAKKSRRLLHSIPVAYSIDGDNGIRDPRGIYGDRLGVQVHLVTANSGTMRTLQTAVEQCHLDVEQFVASPYASGVAALVEDELDLGATVIDMGAGTTTIGVFYDSHLIYASGLPVGGDHVTNDIARGMATPVLHAERFKTLYGTVLAGNGDDQDTIEVPQVGEESQQTSHIVPKSVLNGILRPRLEETFELVRARLSESGVERLAGNRVVLTGGASQLQGVPELATQILDKQVRIGRPLRMRALASSASGPAFATCAGLIAIAAQEPADFLVPQMAHIGERTGISGRLSRWVRDHL